MTYEEWVDQYQPIKNDLAEDRGYDGRMFETFGNEILQVQAYENSTSFQVWTMISGDDGGIYLTNGYHYVNRLGYFVTPGKYEGDSIEIIVGDPDRYHVEDVGGGSFQVLDRETNREICVVSDYDCDSGFSNDAESRADMIAATLNENDASWEPEVTDTAILPTPVQG